MRMLAGRHSGAGSLTSDSGVNRFGTTVARRQVQVGVGARGRHAAAGRALEQTGLEQERLVDLLDRLRLLRHRHRQGVEADGLAGEGRAQRGQDRTVDFVEPELVDLEQLQRNTRVLGRDRAVGSHLGVVAYPLQETVGDTRRAA